MRFLLASYDKNLIRSVVRKSQEFENVLTKGISIFDTLQNTTAKEDVDLLTRELIGVGEFALAQKSGKDTLGTEKAKVTQYS